MKKVNTPEKSSPKRQNEDIFIDSLLRPTCWEDYVGQDRVKQSLNVILSAARKRKESPDHLLFYGQPGLGKTTLAHLVAKEMSANIKVTSGAALEKSGDLAATLSNLEEKDILFIDEAHRINKSIEEILYPAMESRKIHLTVGKGLAGRMLTIDIPQFTLIAATTRVNLLSSPLRARFGAIFQLDYYEIKDIKEIVKRSANLMQIEINDDAVEIIARASRFTPRTANRLLKRARDFAEINNLKNINADIAKQALNLLEIDELGLEPHDRRLLEIIIKKFRGGPVGVNALTASLNEEKGIIEEIYEPYLMKIGLLERTPMGRMTTEEAKKHLKI